MLTLMLIGFLTEPSHATSVKYPESSAIYGIGRIIHLFGEKNHRLPADLEELSSLIGKPIDELYPQVTPSIRYAFYFPPLTIHINEVTSIEVLAIGRKPEMTVTTEGISKRGLKGPGRYLLIREADGEYFARWFDEESIQRFWYSSGILLPPSHNEPERPWVKKVRYQIIGRRFGYAVIFFAIIMFIRSRFRRTASYGEGV